MNTTVPRHGRPPRMAWPAALAAALLLVVLGTLLFQRKPPSAPPAPPPAWRFGNQYFQAAASHDWDGAARLCRDLRSAQAARAMLEPLLRQDGPLQGWGSVGDIADLPPTVRQTVQAYQVTFGGHVVPVRVTFVRGGGAEGGWKISRVQAAPR